jgi:hypothetical protein
MHVKTPSSIPNTFTSQTPYRMANTHYVNRPLGVSLLQRVGHQCCKVTHIMQACQTHSKGAVVPVHAIKACRGIQVQIPSFLTLALDGVEWSTSRSGLLPHPLTGKEPSTHLIGYWVGPKTNSGLDVLNKFTVPNNTYIFNKPMHIDKVWFHNFRNCNFNTKHQAVSVPRSLLNYFKYSHSLY